MSSQIISKEGNTVKISFDVTPEKFEEGMKYSYNKNKSKLTVPGFRKGKVPRKVIEAEFGPDFLYEDAVNWVLNEEYPGVVAELNLEVVSLPDIDVKEVGKDIGAKFEATVTVKPEVKLGQYKGLAVTRHVRGISEKTLDIEMVHQTRMRATYHNSTEAAKRGSRVLLDFAGFMDGKEIPDSRMEKVMVVLGDGKLMPAAEQAIYGHKAGETFRFDFTYPAAFRVPELSGKTAQFEITLHSVAEKTTPELTEAFAQSAGYASLAAMREAVRAKKQKIHEDGADRAAGQKLLEMAGANLTVTVPEAVLDRTADNEMKLLSQRLSRSGISMEQHCKNSRTTAEALRAGYRADAERKIRTMYAARAIAEAENITVRPEEVNAEYRRLSVQQDTPEADIRRVLAPETVAAALAAQKVQRFLLDNAVVTSVMDPDKE